MAIEEFIARKRKLDGSTGTSKATIENHVVTYENSETPSPYITEIKTLNGVSLVGSGNYAFDTAFDETSTNAVQNKVISKEVKELNYELAVLREAVFEVTLSEIDYTSVFTDSFAIPETLTDTDGTHRVVFSETELKKVAGNSVVMNQLVQNGNFENTSGWTIAGGSAPSLTVSNNIGTVSGIIARYTALYRDVSVVKNHIYLVSAKIQAPSPKVQLLADERKGGSVIAHHRANSSGTNTLLSVSAIVTATADDSVFRVGFTDDRASDWTDVSITDVFLTSLTQLFGAGNEPASVDDVRIQWLISYLENNPTYDAGTIKSSIINGLQSLDSNDEVIGTITIPPTEIKSAGTAQDYVEVVEGDIVEGEQLYNLVKPPIIGSVDLGTLNWNYWSQTDSFRTNSLNSVLKFANNPSVTNMTCSKYKSSSWDNKDNLSIFTYNDGSTKYLCAKDTSFNGDATAFKQAMNGVPLNYQLASPTQTTIATNLHFSEISMLIAEGGTIKPLYDNVPVDTTLTFVVKKAISE